MYFVLSKTIGLLILPSNFLIALILLGLLLMLLRRPRSGKIVAATGLILLLVVGFLPIGYLLTHILENRFPVWDPARGPPDGIIVLGGAIDPLLSRTRGQVTLGESAERVTVVAKLARDYPKAHIVFSGGDASLLANKGNEADYLLPLLESFGVPAARVTLEKRARNTYENAVYTKALVKPQPRARWLLVTSARHMPRAIGCFRQAGFPVEAYPVDWQTTPSLRWNAPITFATGLATADDAGREWIGLLVYWLTGRTSALLPRANLPATQ